MKKLLSLAFALTIALSVNAQIETPQPSPSAKLQQKVGLTDITIEYSRPGVKGRTIFGGLEPWGNIWRTGANKNTIITFSPPSNMAMACAAKNRIFGGIWPDRLARAFKASNCSRI